MKYIVDIIKGFWSLIIGLKVTIINFFKPSQTLQYPLEKWTLPDCYRGMLQVTDYFNKDTISDRSRYFQKEQTPPCDTTCPANTDARGYVAAIAEGDFKRGVRILKDIYPFAGSLGRVCPAPCEKECSRYIAHNSAITIRQLKRFLADFDYNLPKEERAPLYEGKINYNGSKIAVIGAGPAGLACAVDLTKKGCKVTVFEKLGVGGGYLYVGIPSYRLPKDILKDEIEQITTLGVEIRYNTEIGKDIKFEDLKNLGYKAIFIGTGAIIPVKLNIPGEDLEGVYGGEDFLQRINLGEEFKIGKKVVVVGGGNTAVDAARTSLRLGAEEVSILYRRTLNEMPADPHEVHDAQEEGVKIEILVGPTKVLGTEVLGTKVFGEKHKVTGIEVCKMQLGEQDSSGRRKPVPIPGCNFVYPCDNIFTSVSRQVQSNFLPSELKLTKWGTIEADEKTGTTSMNGVFAGGDATLGPATAIEAIACGKRAATAINEFISKG